MFCTCTDINCANFTTNGGTFFCRKSMISRSDGSFDSVSTTFSAIWSIDDVSLMSLLIRMSRIVIDNNLLTSELRKLLRMLISSICCNSWGRRETTNSIIVNHSMCSVGLTYNRKSIFDYFDGTQRKWETDTSKFDLHIESFYQKISDEHR